MLEAYPVAFLPENHALAIAIMSYNGQMNFGLLGDFDALPDIDVIGENIADELATLVALAREPVPAAVATARTAARATAPATHQQRPQPRRASPYAGRITAALSDGTMWPTSASQRHIGTPWTARQMIQYKSAPQHT